MVRAPCCEMMGMKKGPWTPEEDDILVSHIHRYGHDNWRALPKQAGLLRCGKSCRLRWTNYLRPNIKRGNFSREEEETITKLHQVLGNRWSAIATRLPGRTDNEIKNFWNTHLKKKALQYQHMPNQSMKIDDNPKNSSHQLVESTLVGNATIYAQEFSDLFLSTSQSSTIRTASLDQQTHMINGNAATNIPDEVYELKSCSTTSSTTSTSKFQGIRQYKVVEPMDGNNLNVNVNDDVVFWYSLLIKAGESENS